MMPKGKIKIAVKVGESPRKAKVSVEFIVITSHSPCNAIMVQPLLFNLKAIILMYHYSLKFPTPFGVEEVKENRDITDKFRITQTVLA